jgi:hypothetical protein
MNRSFLVLVGASVAVALTIAVFVLTLSGGNLDRAIDAEAASATQELARRDERIAALEKANRILQEEVRLLRDMVEAREKGLAAPAVPGGTGRPVSVAPAATGPAAGSGDPSAAPGSGAPGKEALTWDALAGKLAGMIEMGKKANESPSPEFLQSVAELMGLIGKFQKQFGFDDPGLVTEAPAFKAGFVARVLEMQGAPLSAAQKAELDRSAEEAMPSYTAAARRDPEGFVLDRDRKVVKSSAEFDERLGRIVGKDALAGLPGAEGKAESGRVEDTEWPDHCCTGVKDLEGATDWLSRKWKERLGVRNEDGPALRAIAREFAEKSHAARLRGGFEKESDVTREGRRALDQEIAGFEVEALRRIHDTLPLSDESRAKVRNYRTLDRFEIGRVGGFSRSGSFGGMVVQTDGNEPK